MNESEITDNYRRTFPRYEDLNQMRRAIGFDFLERELDNFNIITRGKNSGIPTFVRGGTGYDLGVSLTDHADTVTLQVEYAGPVEFHEVKEQAINVMITRYGLDQPWDHRLSSSSTGDDNTSLR